MRNIFKKLFVPSGEKAELTAYKSWIVRWRSYHESYSLANLRDEAEIFPSQQDAEMFAQSLRDAFELAKCSHYTVRVEENQSKLATLPK